MLGNTSDQKLDESDLKQVEQEINQIFQGMRKAMLEDPNPTWKTRLDRLERMEALVLDNRKDIEEAVCEDFNQRSDFVTAMADVMPTLGDIRNLKSNGEEWMKPYSSPVDWFFLPAKGRIIPQPKGVAGIICPWNYPLLLSFGPASQAVAAGNLVMLKLSEYTPKFQALMKKLTAQYFKPEEFAIILGGHGVGSVFSSVPFDQILFTGSPRTGKAVMAAAAKNLTPVILELGGKSPTVIAPEYPLEHAAERILWGKLLNAGQTCIAPDYVLIEKSRMEDFADACKKVANKFYPKGIADEDYCSIITEKRFEVLLQQLDEESSKCKFEPMFEGEQVDKQHRKIAPKLEIDPPLDSIFMEEEIFGPVLPVVPYPDGQPEEAIKFIAARPHPLATYWFDNDSKRYDHVLVVIKTGGIVINDTFWQAIQRNLPFGGIGNSGMGRYNGRVGFDAFSNMKPAMIQSKVDFVELANPPYSPKFRKAVEVMITDKLFGKDDESDGKGEKTASKDKSDSKDKKAKKPAKPAKKSSGKSKKS